MTEGGTVSWRCVWWLRGWQALTDLLAWPRARSTHPPAGDRRLTPAVLFTKFSRVTRLEDVRERWDDAYQRALRSCRHGPSCTTPGCQVGKARQEVHLLCGE